MELLGTSLKNILMSAPQLKGIICQRYFFDTKDICPNEFILGFCLCGDKEDEKIAMSIHASPMSCGNWTLQTHWITAWLRQKATSADHLAQLLLRVGSPKAGCSGPCPVGLWRSLRMETPQLLWATCASVQPPFQQKSFFLHLRYLNLCSFPIVLSPLRKARLCLLYTLTSGIYAYWHYAYFPRLNSPHSLSVSSYVRYSSSLTIFMDLHWTFSNIPVSLL